MSTRPANDPFCDREVPQWFRDAKLGIFIHWGVYSVPAWAVPPGPRGDGGTQLLDLFQIDAESMQDADRVSKNGNLLLGIGPKADGSIPEVQAERLRGLGRWLRANAEAIYETRPWSTHRAETETGMEVRFTRRDDRVYAITLGTPDRFFVLEHIDFEGPLSATRVGGGPAEISRVPEGTRITCGSLPDAPAHSFCIVPE